MSVVGITVGKKKKSVRKNDLPAKVVIIFETFIVLTHSGIQLKLYWAF